MRTNANVAAQNIKFYKNIGGLLVCKGIRIRFRENLKYILIEDSVYLNVQDKNKINMLDNIRFQYGIAVVKIADMKLYAFFFKKSLDFAREKPFN